MTSGHATYWVLPSYSGYYSTKPSADEIAMEFSGEKGLLKSTFFLEGSKNQRERDYMNIEHTQDFNVPTNLKDAWTKH